MIEMSTVVFRWRCTPSPRVTPPPVLLHFAMNRDQIINLAAGPSALPQSVLEEAAQGLLNYEGTGIGITELSHRSKEFQALTDSLEHSIRSILNVPETHVILFTQGGGCGQFAAVVLNLLARHHMLYPQLAEGEERTMDYVITGSWSKKAAEEARILAGNSPNVKVNVVVDSRDHSANGKSFDRIPDAQNWKFSKAPAFIYYCDNETVDGVQFANDASSPAAFPHHLIPPPPPTAGDIVPVPIPLIGDHSSSFLSRPILNMEQHALIYAGAQKNLGPAGLTVLIVRKDLLVDTAAASAQFGSPVVPTTMSYKVLADAGSLYHTPPMFSMYVSLLALRYYIANGGLEELEKRNRAKQEKIYEVVDDGVKEGVFVGKVRRESRSWMNVTFTLSTKELEEKFVGVVHAKGVRGYKGHR